MGLKGEIRNYVPHVHGQGQGGPARGRQEARWLLSNYFSGKKRPDVPSHRKKRVVHTKAFTEKCDALALFLGRSLFFRLIILREREKGWLCILMIIRSELRRRVESCK